MERNLLEAQEWLRKNEKNLAWCDKWILIGGGDGLHLQVLKERFPETFSKKLFGVLDFDSCLTFHPYPIATHTEQVKFWEQRILQEPHTRWGIFTYPAAWQGLDPIYELEYQQLLRIVKKVSLQENSFQNPEFFNDISKEMFV